MKSTQSEAKHSRARSSAVAEGGVRGAKDAMIKGGPKYGGGLVGVGKGGGTDCCWTRRSGWGGQKKHVEVSPVEDAMDKRWNDWSTAMASATKKPLLSAK